ncbi:MAG: late competence development ComFB family protein [Aestuariibacter sp.]
MQFDDDVHNYYETLVSDYIAQINLYDKYESDFIADVCCVALNHLPPKYIRYEVDMAFFLPPEERLKMQDSVVVAIKDAIKTVTEWSEKEK